MTAIWLVTSRSGDGIVSITYELQARLEFDIRTTTTFQTNETLPR
jgi:hypothetical protein